MPVDPDPRAHISSSEDFYALFSLPVDFAPEELRRAFRKKSIKYHPDKTIKPGFTEEQKDRARDDWDKLEVAFKVLEDADLRKRYDQAREARERRRVRNAEADSVRREMIERLEKGEQLAANKKRKGARYNSDGDSDPEWEEKERNRAQVQRMREDRLRRQQQEMDEVERDQDGDGDGTSSSARKRRKAPSFKSFSAGEGGAKSETSSKDFQESIFAKMRKRAAADRAAKEMRNASAAGDDA